MARPRSRSRFDPEIGPPICEMQRAELERQGAKAAARGEAVGTNPMLRLVNGTAATGEATLLWRARHDAWERGFRAQSRAVVFRFVQ